MKKKLLVLTLVAVLALSTVLTGCTFFKLNKERQANEIMATISDEYNGQTIELTVSRNELISYVSYIINLYSQSGLSYDAKSLVEQGLDALINQKYLVIQGMKYLMELDHRKAVAFCNTDEYKKDFGTKLTPEGVLTLAERYTAIASTNESFETSINTDKDEYNDGHREREVSNAREKLASLYSQNYSVKENGTAVYYKDGEEFKAGLYKDSFIYDADKTVEPDYKSVYLRIDLAKSGADDETVYLPVGESAVTTEVNEDAEFVSQYITAKYCVVKYSEPTKDEKGDDTTKEHTAKAEFTLVTPRTAYSKPDEEDERDAATLLEEGSVKFRYNNFSQLNDELNEIIAKGTIFEHTKEVYESDAEKDAYRKFREDKKGLLIGFDPANDDRYNSLGYYYKSAYENAVLTAVQHELKRAALTEKPITDADIEAQYKILVEKQKEEYSVLDAKGQIDKFAETIKTDLTSAYYVPIDALLKEEFEYNGKTYHYAEQGENGYTINMFYIAHILFKWTDELKSDMDQYIKDRDDEEVKEIKSGFISYLKTNKSVLSFATADEKGDELKDVFFVNEDGTIAKFDVRTVIDELKSDMAASDKPLEVFKEYMTYFNDDSGSMNSDLGYFVAMGDIAHSYDGDDFPDTAKDLYLKLLENGDPNNANEISEDAFTSYGLHIEYISFAPFYNITLTAEGGLGVDFKLDLKGSMFRTTIKDSLESSVNSAKYTEWTEKYDSDEALSKATKDNKKLKQLLKDLGVK